MNFGVREVANVTFRTLAALTIGSQSFVAGEPVLYFDSLKASTLTGSANTVFATGGRGNNKLIGWDGDKEIVFTIEDALISPESFAILSGADLVEFDGSTTKAKNHKRQVVQLNASDQATLAETVLTGNADFPVYVYDSDEYGNIGTKLTLTTDYTIATNVISGVTKTEGDWLIVDYYFENTNVVKSLIVKIDSFGGYFKIEGETLWRSEETGADHYAYLTIPRAKIRTNFEFTMTPDGDPSTFTFELDAFPATISGVGTNLLFVFDVEEY